jgi:hypothetical protein
MQQPGAEDGFMAFDAVYASSTCLACKSQLEMNRYSVSTLFAPPPLSLHATAGKFLFLNNSRS